MSRFVNKWCVSTKSHAHSLFTHFGHTTSVCFPERVKLGIKKKQKNMDGKKKEKLGVNCGKIPDSHTNGPEIHRFTYYYVPK